MMKFLMILFFSIGEILIIPMLNASESIEEVYFNNELIEYIYQDDIDGIRFSILNGSDPNQVTYNKTPLIFAIEQKNIDAVRELIFLGANPNQTVYLTRDKCSSPITAALMQPEILKFLIQSGADVNQKLYSRITALHIAAQGGFYFRDDTHEALSILLENGAEVDLKDLGGNTPLHLASKRKKAKNFGKLIDYGANVLKINDEKKNALHYAYSSCDIEMLQELAIRKIPLHDKSCLWNALHHACMLTLPIQNKMVLIKWLIEEQKMNINEYATEYTEQVTYSILTPFGFAVGSQIYQGEDFTLLEYLIESGTDINAPCIISEYFKPRCSIVGYQSILKWAINNKVPSYIVEWLIEHGAK